MYDFSFKLALLGEESVGKTALLNQLIYKRFKDPHSISNQHLFKTIDLQGGRIRLELWDDEVEVK